MRSARRATRPATAPGALGALVALFVLFAAGVGWATPAAADTTLEVRGGAGSGFLPGHHVPIIVTVHADRLLRGVIRVTTNEMNMRFNGMGMPGIGTVEIPIEVAGGSTKDVVAVVPGTAPNRGASQNDFSASVVLAEGDTELARRAVNLQARDWEETIGVLPKLAADGKVPEHAPLRFTSGTANLVPINPLVLDAGSDGLGPFASIIGAANDLDAMAPAARRAVLEWVGQGGHLLVDADRGPIAGLPAPWQPADGGWSIAGAGDVRLTGGEATAGHWANLFDPTAGGSPSQVAPFEMMGNVGNFGVGNESVASSLGADAGFHLPPLSVLMGLLAVYVLAVGPITFVVLARLRRRHLAWVAVPAVAAIFTAVIAVGGAALRSDTDVAHGTIIDISPTGSRASSATLVGSINGGHASVDMPAGWVADTDPTINDFGPAMTSAPPPLTTTASGVSAVMTLDPGEFTLVRSTGPVSGYDTALEVRATTDGSAVTGTVKNNLPVELTQATVLVHQTATVIGTIGPGEEKEFTVATPLKTGNGSAPELSIWPHSPADAAGNEGFGMDFAQACMPGPNGCNPMPQRPEDRDTDVNSAVWTGWSSAQQTSLRALGAVSVVGWTDDVASPLQLDGVRPIERGRTAFVAHANIEVRVLDTIGARIEEVRDTDLRKELTTERDLQVNGKLYRIILPATVDGRPLDPTTVTIRPPSGFHQIAVPGETEWTNVPVQDDRIEYHVKKTDVVAGVLYVRTRIGDQFAISPDVEFSAPLKGWQIVIGEGAGGHGADLDLEPSNGVDVGVPVPVPAPPMAVTTDTTFPPFPTGGEVSPPTSLEVPPTRATTPPGTIAPPGPVTGAGS